MKLPANKLIPDALQPAFSAMLDTYGLTEEDALSECIVFCIGLHQQGSMVRGATLLQTLQNQANSMDQLRGRMSETISAAAHVLQQNMAVLEMVRQAAVEAAKDAKLAKSSSP